MRRKMPRLALAAVCAALLVGCQNVVAQPPTAQSGDLSSYAFPDSVDPSLRYLFYLHGRIIEDQGIPAVSPDYGEYEYAAILDTLRSHKLRVISEIRPKNADVTQYSEKISREVTSLLQAGVPEGHITVVGASKGAWIAILVSHILESTGLNFVIMGICDPATVQQFIQDGTYLYGRVLSIYESSDKFGGSCRRLLEFSGRDRIPSGSEIVLDLGTGHGFLYKPLDAWILPVVQWAQEP